jgi:hypothetical protein
MHPSLPLLLPLIPSLALAIVIPPSWPASNNNNSPAARSPSPEPEPALRIPLKHLTSRQHHPDLEVRQAWLKDQGRGMRRKYAKHLDEDAQELLRRDQDEVELEKRELYKRATGNVS